jgi:hypothetical protein
VGQSRITLTKQKVAAWGIRGLKPGIVTTTKGGLDMNNQSKQSNSPWSRLGEDWWSVIIGLILALLVYLGVLVKIPW